MSDSLPGALGPPVLGGHLLDQANVFAQDFTEQVAATVVTLGRGRRREAIAYQGAGNPLKRIRYDLVLRYAHLGPHLDLVSEILSLPGPHDVVVWKRVHPSYAGDGSRVEFTLPWRVATDVYSLLIPPGLQTAEPFLQPGARIAARGVLGGALTVTVEDQATYDGGSPGAGEAWILEGGQTIKVGTVPTSSQFLHVKLVPVLEMFERPESQRSLPAGTMREPRDIALMER